MATDREIQLLSDAMAAEITSPKELANFMAQVTHESNGLTHLEESFRYTKGNFQIPVDSAWQEGDTALTAARLEALQGKPEKLAELMYGGRSGNDQPGDGYTYRGRGYIQLTGKANYREAGNALGLDLVKHPELASEPQNASKIATWYWENKVPGAAREDVRAATKAVNGKYNGLEDREARFVMWEKILTPEAMERVSKGQTELTIEPNNHKHHGASPQTAGNANLDTETIRTLQTNLAHLGYTDARGHVLPADGNFGIDTRHAVECFQHDHGLAVDSIAGPKTLEALHQQDLAQAKSASPHLDHPAHPDHALYQQARNAVHRLDAVHRRAFDQRSDNLAAALTVAARRDGLHTIDAVVLSDDASRAFAVQGKLDSPLRQIAHVQTVEAINTPMTQNSIAWPQLLPPPPDAAPLLPPSEQQQAAQPTSPGMSQ
jgi:putative chitinase